MNKFNDLTKQEKIKLLQDSAKESARLTSFLYSGIFAVFIIALIISNW